MDNDLILRLDAEAPLIEELQRISGAPALSLGVFHNSRIIYTKHFGRRDIARPEAPNDDTIYYLASVSKLIGVCGVARLVSDGLLEWDKPIQEYLPEFNRPNDEFGRNATLRDLACQRTGLPLANFWWGQMQGEPLLSTTELVRITTQLDAIKPFRSAFYYSPWNYILIHAVVERVTGKPFGKLVDELILHPLGLDDMTFEIPVETSNIARSHAVRDDGTVVGIPINSLDSGTGLGACMGGKSSMRDTLRFFSAILEAYNHQVEHEVDEMGNSPFRQLRTVFSPHIPLAKESPTSYCLGNYRTKLPAVLSCASLNAPLLGKKAPLFGANVPRVDIIHHTGNIPGAFGSYFLVPGSRSGVVCLTNATPLFDPTDFAAQVALGILLGEKKRSGLTSLAKIAVKTQLGWYGNIERYLTAKRTDTPPSLPLTKYAGTYINAVDNFKLVVKSSDMGLRVAIQRSKKTTYELLTLDGDTFCRPGNRDFDVCRGMFPYPFPPLRIVTFTVREGKVVGLVWHTDMFTKPDAFRKMSVQEKMWGRL